LRDPANKQTNADKNITSLEEVIKANCAIPSKERRWVFISPRIQWRRYVIKYGGQGQSGQAIKLYQAAQKSFILDAVKLAELSNNSFNEEM